jgi:hypothetical protein
VLGCVCLLLTWSWCPTACNPLLTSNLVSESLGLDDSDVVDDSLVEVEILGEPAGG